MKTHSYQIFDFSQDIDLFDQFGPVPNFGDGDQTEILHPVFELIKDQIEIQTRLKLIITSARIIYTLDDIEGCQWHFDHENEYDMDTDYTMLLYCNDMTIEGGGLLEFKDETLCPKRGVGVFIQNKNEQSLHRATPLKEKIPRKLFKITFKNA